jgi:hypothetical protein
MVKNPIPLAPDLCREPRRRKWIPIISVFVVAPLMAPLVKDLVTLCYGQWRTMLGTPVEVRTPTLDAIGERVEAVRYECWYHVSSRFQRVPWNPGIVLPIAVAIMALAMIMLRL